MVNGSGVGGQAGLAGQELSQLGYHATVSGDAPNFGLATTEIEYAPDSLAAAQQLQGQLIGGATLIEDSALAPTAYNLEVVTGQSFKGVTGPSASSGTCGRCRRRPPPRRRHDHDRRQSRLCRDPNRQPGFLLGLRRGLHPARTVAGADAPDLRGVSTGIPRPSPALEPAAFEPDPGG